MKLLSLALLARVAFAATDYTAPLYLNENSIFDHYMVSFIGNHTIEAHEATINHSLSGQIRHIWDIEPFGYAARLDNKTLELVRTDPNVEFVEQDFVMYFPDFEDLGPGRGVPGYTSNYTVNETSLTNITVLSEDTA